VDVRSIPLNSSSTGTNRGIPPSSSTPAAVCTRAKSPRGPTGIQERGANELCPLGSNSRQLAKWRSVRLGRTAGSKVKRLGTASHYANERGDNMTYLFIPAGQAFPGAGMLGKIAAVGAAILMSGILLQGADASRGLRRRLKKRQPSDPRRDHAGGAAAGRSAGRARVGRVLTERLRLGRIERSRGAQVRQHRVGPGLCAAQGVALH